MIIKASSTSMSGENMHARWEHAAAALSSDRQQNSQLGSAGGMGGGGGLGGGVGGGAGSLQGMASGDTSHTAAMAWSHGAGSQPYLRSAYSATAASYRLALAALPAVAWPRYLRGVQGWLVVWWCGGVVAWAGRLDRPSVA
jgi:hypothetical protein